MRHADPHAYCYVVVATDSKSAVDGSVVGLTWLDPVDPISSEIRVSVGQNISRIVMRVAKITLPPERCNRDDGGPIVLAWEVLDCQLAVSRGFVKLFAEIDDGHAFKSMLKRKCKSAGKPFFEMIEKMTAGG